MSRIGIVIIGRNEGERLRRCLQSVIGADHTVVYVDSGSSDDSVALARSLGADCVELDMAVPFTAARARNAGFERLMKAAPAVQHVQFIDGDCELIGDWLCRAAAELDAQPQVAIVCGHVVERHPDATIYNRMCALEWRKNPGEIRACGGIFMIRAEVFRAAGGFREDVMAAEDDELCLRVRRAEWRIVQIDVPMVWHDAAITRFGQWWRRAKRAGHAFAQGAALHGRSPDRHFVRECRSVLFWALLVPLASLALAWWTHGLSLLMLLAYPALAWRIARRGRERGWTAHDARAYAIFTVLGKWAQLLGMAQYWRTRWTGRRAVLIEYKEAVRLA